MATDLNILLEAASYLEQLEQRSSDSHGAASGNSSVCGWSSSVANDVRTTSGGGAANPFGAQGLGADSDATTTSSSFQTAVAAASAALHASSSAEETDEGYHDSKSHTPSESPGPTTDLSNKRSSIASRRSSTYSSIATSKRNSSSSTTTSGDKPNKHRCSRKNSGDVASLSTQKHATFRSHHNSSRSSCSGVQNSAADDNSVLFEEEQEKKPPSLAKVEVDADDNDDSMHQTEAEMIPFPAYISSSTQQIKAETSHNNDMVFAASQDQPQSTVLSSIMPASMLPCEVTSQSAVTTPIHRSSLHNSVLFNGMQQIQHEGIQQQHYQPAFVQLQTAAEQQQQQQPQARQTQPLLGIVYHPVTNQPMLVQFQQQLSGSDSGLCSSLPSPTSAAAQQQHQIDQPPQVHQQQFVTNNGNYYGIVNGNVVSAVNPVFLQQQQQSQRSVAKFYFPVNINDPAAASPPAATVLQYAAASSAAYQIQNNNLVTSHGNFSLHAPSPPAAPQLQQQHRFAIISTSLGQQLCAIPIAASSTHHQLAQPLVVQQHTMSHAPEAVSDNSNEVAESHQSCKRPYALTSSSRAESSSMNKKTSRQHRKAADYAEDGDDPNDFDYSSFETSPATAPTKYSQRGSSSKMTHNEVERQRRAFLRQCFERLRTTLKVAGAVEGGGKTENDAAIDENDFDDESRDPTDSSKMPMGELLRIAVDEVQRLNDEQHALKAEYDRHKQLKRELTENISRRSTNNLHLAHQQQNACSSSAYAVLRSTAPPTTEVVVVNSARIITTMPADDHHDTDEIEAKTSGGMCATRHTQPSTPLACTQQPVRRPRGRPPGTTNKNSAAAQKRRAAAMATLQRANSVASNSNASCSTATAPGVEPLKQRLREFVMEATAANSNQQHFTPTSVVLMPNDSSYVMMT